MTNSAVVRTRLIAQFIFRFLSFFFFYLVSIQICKVEVTHFLQNCFIYFQFTCSEWSQGKVQLFTLQGGQEHTKKIIKENEVNVEKRQR